jgi:hypothetical protein
MNLTEVNSGKIELISSPAATSAIALSGIS